MSELLQDRIATQAELHPDGVAIVMRDEQLSYAELERQSNRLARLLVGAGVRRGDRVCLLMPKSPEAVVAMLGVLKADAIYVPLDVTDPASRLAKVFDLCDNRWTLASGAVGGALGELFADPAFARRHSVGWMSSTSAGDHNVPAAFSLADLQSHSAEPFARHSSADDPAHILYTSGSTGVPKGVINTHANVLAFLDWARGYFGTTPADRISWHAPLHVDLSTFDVFGTLGAGARLCPVPPEVTLLPHRLVRFMAEMRLTQWLSVPSVLTHVAKFDALPWEGLPTLRRVLWCGEVLPTPTLVHWMRRVPRASFTNLYGHTETTIASSYWTVPACPSDDRADLPIGQACAGTDLLVLDADKRPAPVGEVGDLYIGGVGLSPGYWRDVTKTRAAFVPHPWSGDRTARLYKTGDLARVGKDGLVYFVGRTDSQIKSRGYRIELGEVETALEGLQLLHECAVVAIPSDGFEGMAICCAYVSNGAGPVRPAALRERLAKVVPQYMLPSRWLDLDSLPRNGNGKVDRLQLRAAFTAPPVPVR